jgi:N-acyl-D-amino-acid deacylase
MRGKTVFFAAGLMTSTALVLAACTATPKTQYDLLIENGTVVDGTGAAGVKADVGITGGKIVFVGDAPAGAGKEVVDATGLIVSPGFIDVHNHSIDNYKQLKGPVTDIAYLVQGVTTVVGGPDGFASPADIKGADASLKASGIAINYAFYVGHNGIRASVMGASHAKATPEQIEKMRAQVREGMELGAVGLSSGLMYEPGMFGDTAEVVALAKEVKPFNGIYDSHVRDPGFHLLESDAECLQIGREAGIPAKIGHEKAVGLQNKGKMKDIIAMVEKARAAGEDAVTDQYVYDGAATASLENLIVTPEIPSPTTTAEVQAYTDKMHAFLAKPGAAAGARQATEKGVNGGFSWVKAVGYGSMRIVDSKDYPDLVGKNIQLLAQERGVAPYDLIIDLITKAKSPVMITLGSIEEAEVKELLVQKWNMISSDGDYVGPEAPKVDHPRTTGAFARVLGKYTREEKLLTLPEAVRKMTSFPADFLRLGDRGRVAVGKAADLAIFSEAEIGDRSTWTQPELLSVGVKYVVVNGKLSLKDGKPTGAMPGTWVKPIRTAAK